METEKLSNKQKRFIEEYFKDFNAKQAAIRAGYSARSAAEIGYENLIKPHVKEAIVQMMDVLSMSAAEAAKRFTEWGRGTIEPFIEYVTESNENEDKEEPQLETPKKTYALINISTDKARHSLHLIKKIKQGKYGLELELHSPMEAVDKIARIRGMYLKN